MRIRNDRRYAGKDCAGSPITRTVRSVGPGGALTPERHEIATQLNQIDVESRSHLMPPRVQGGHVEPHSLLQASIGFDHVAQIGTNRVPDLSAFIGKCSDTRAEIGFGAVFPSIVGTEGGQKSRMICALVDVAGSAICDPPTTLVLVKGERADQAAFASGPQTNDLNLKGCFWQAATVAMDHPGFPFGAHHDRKRKASAIHRREDSRHFAGLA